MKRVFRLFPPRRHAVSGEPDLGEQPLSYARSPEGDAIIRLRLSSPAALLMPFESFPINFGQDLESEKKRPILNLNKDLIEYLFARVAELGDESLLLRVTLPAAPQPLTSADLKPSDREPVVLTFAGMDFPAQALHNAIQRYFSHLENVRRQSLLKLAKDAALLGLLGAGALGLSAFLEARNTPTSAGIGSLLLIQGITVFGWLTLWEALANALWNWRPLYQQQIMCHRLQAAKFELAADVSQAPI